MNNLIMLKGKIKIKKKSKEKKNLFKYFLNRIYGFDIIMIKCNKVFWS